MRATLNLFSLFIFIVSGSLLLSCNRRTEVGDAPITALSPSELVYPFLDAANSRWFFFNSATRPFGMVNLSPDTQIGGAWGSGYRYNTDTIKGLSHIHAWQLSGLSVLPVVYSDENSASVMADYYSAFKHESEVAAPGYHRLHLDRYGLDVELTSTTRVGFHRYRFPETGRRGLVLNMGGTLGPSDIKDGTVKLEGEKGFSGSLVNAPTRRRPKDSPVFFYVETSEAIVDLEPGPDGKFLLTFADNAASELLMKVGISYTSVENARQNLQTELDHWDFDAVKEASADHWDEMLGRIEISGGTETQQRRFYTDLWHALQGRRIISDVNGAYPDNTGATFRIGQIPLDAAGKPRFNHYNSDSFWGAQWTINTLWGLVYPEIYDEFVQSLLQYYHDGGLVPRGPSGGNYTHVMTGASSTPFVVSAYQKGITDVDPEMAYQALKKNHMPGGTMGRAGYEHDTEIGGGLEDYINKGYVPYPNPNGNYGFHQDGPSLTMEYAYQDWTLAQMAKALGKTDDYNYFMERSKNYKNTFDPEVGWMRPRNAAGEWQDPYSPYQYQRSGFNESNGAQSTWFVPQDLEGLAELMGGKEQAIAKLQQQFEKASELGFTSGNSHEKEAHPEYSEIPINYGNQPSIQTLFVFQSLGRPELTQFWTAQVIDSVYGGLSPETGYSGDEDQGLMGSLAVLLKMGLFQMSGGTEENPAYLISTPLFERVKVHLHPDYFPGKTFEITAPGRDAGKLYIGSAAFDGKTLPDLSLRHQDIIRGGTLALDLKENRE
ncbi:GH92 family glycosyl hydrolase [Flavilitoribacter nigricans]|uniref:Alpha-mannosidase n=1 Tax=Flavilitoribacter nigricans (strain ATCC 23147 / DSM 23189 / NBRC 102662 / NCIMB 1420 / SS-2) TaxID=1122177 RepID=A0A2D0N786_FLAN2|nr:GH92 family glycosyl hydrolase [Flavilitoribacter nigricans]PHN03989.1 alpha-mannosidase [Flavilitoribacter nigricans DSM 23189 = NBRC 102662]